MWRDDGALSVQVVHENGSLVLRVAGELDLATAPVLTETVSELLSPHLRSLTLDVESVTFLGLAGMRGFWILRESCRSQDTVFRLQNMSDSQVRHIAIADFPGLSLAIDARSVRRH